MGNISRHTGINIGGLNSISWIFREDVAGIFTFQCFDAYCSVLLPNLVNHGISIYGTPETIQLESEQQDTPGGMKYVYKLKILVPKDRAPVESELLPMTGRRLILKSADKNGTIRIFGTMDCPMKVTSKLLKPAVMETFNGMNFSLLESSSMPAGF